MDEKLQYVCKQLESAGFKVYETYDANIHEHVISIGKDCVYSGMVFYEDDDKEKFINTITKRWVKEKARADAIRRNNT